MTTVIVICFRLLIYNIAITIIIKIKYYFLKIEKIIKKRKVDESLFVNNNNGKFVFNY